MMKELIPFKESETVRQVRLCRLGSKRRKGDKTEDTVCRTMEYIGELLNTYYFFNK